MLKIDITQQIIKDSKSKHYKKYSSKNYFEKSELFTVQTKGFTHEKM